MFENKTYEALLKSALARVDPGIDKREGSMVMNGVAPSMAELAQLYIGLDFVFSATYLLTAPREYLIKRASDRNMSPYPASAAVFRAEFNKEVANGTRFSCEDLNFVVTGRMESADTDTSLAHQVTCETVGSIANSYVGTLIPIEYVDGLTHAELVELIVPGDDEEDTEVFRQRVLDSFQSQAFGGNQADYTEKVVAMAGVSAVKVHPVWNESIAPSSLIPDDDVTAWYEASVGTLSAPVAAWLTAVYTAAKDKLLTVGGTVKLVIMASNNAAPSSALLEEVQTAVDPVQNAGEGLGLAPIGHVVNVTGVEEEPVNITLNLTYASGWSWEAVRSYVEAVIDSYFEELASAWSGSDYLTVRISQIESRILSECSAMVTDIGGTQINGKEANLVLGADSIPVRGAIDG
jgi:uncharacterized phage protein gp47/JayE